MKKFISVLLAVIMVFGTGAVAFAENQTSVPEGYTGIYTAEDLYNIRNNLSGRYIIMNDIDLSVYENWEPIGTWEEPFTGELDGNGYVVKNLTIKQEYDLSSSNSIGVIGSAYEAKIKNICVVDADIEATWLGETEFDHYFNIGIVCGRLTRSELLFCSAAGEISSSGFRNVYTGGIIGFNSSSKIKNCSNYADFLIEISSTSRTVYVGGIGGYWVATSNSSECSNYGDITISGENQSEYSVLAVGGICGFQGANYYKLLNCYNRGDVECDFSSNKVYIGGIAGISSIITNSYNSGNVSVPNEFSGYCGGISGNIQRKAFESYPGAPDFERIENSYYINTDLNPAYCEEETPNEIPSHIKEYTFLNVSQVSGQKMKTQSTFVEFDFETVWEMEENGYPVLKNQPTVTIKENIELVEGDVYSDKIIANEWTTTNPDIATVNENGEIVAVGIGEATITIEYRYGYIKEINIKTKEDDQNKNKLNACLIKKIGISVWRFVNKTIRRIFEFLRIF